MVKYYVMTYKKVIFIFKIINHYFLKVSEEEEEESEQIMAKFKDRPGKKSEKKKMQEMVKQRAMEPWINLNFIPHNQYFSRVNSNDYLKFLYSASLYIIFTTQYKILFLDFC